MKTANEIKSIVREKYSMIAGQTANAEHSCCTIAGCCGDGSSLMADSYNHLDGYIAEADLGLGCGLPTEYVLIKAGNVVVDPGSGAGNDAFIARKIVGESGRVIGVDFTEAMISRAKTNQQRLGFDNVEFRLGEIESIPVTSAFADIIVSNCVLNLVPNKHLAFSEIFRVLKPGGHFCISDIVLTEELPAPLKEVAEMYAGCVSGAIQENEYLKIIQEAGFRNVKIQKAKAIAIPENELLKYISPDLARSLSMDSSPIKSITVYAEKPSKDDRKCCEPNSSCC